MDHVEVGIILPIGHQRPLRLRALHLHVAGLGERLPVLPLLESLAALRRALDDQEACDDDQHTQPVATPTDGLLVVHLAQHPSTRHASDHDVGALEERDHENRLVLLQRLRHEGDVRDGDQDAADEDHVWQPIRPSAPIPGVAGAPQHPEPRRDKVHVARDAACGDTEGDAPRLVADPLGPGPQDYSAGEEEPPEGRHVEDEAQGEEGLLHPCERLLLRMVRA
mmetsp:Transcript_68516/g.192033  ORF Transcript_68516/g.192033 Transcript_68516/m.192033 type:complete len:223 (-) Transcript_68516:418-1086(-)